jgi:hypothetical protein
MSDKKISQLTGATTPLAGTEVLPIVQSGATVKVDVSNLTAGRSVSGANFIPSGATIPTNGMYSPAANVVGFANNSLETFRTTANNTIQIGSSSGTSTSKLFLYANNSVGDAVTNAAVFLRQDGTNHIQAWTGSGGSLLAYMASTGDFALSSGNLVIGTSGKGIDFSADPSAAGMTSELLDDYEEGTWTPANVNMTVNSGTWAATGTYTKIGNIVTFSVIQTSGNVSLVAGNAMVSGLPFTPPAQSVCVYTNSAATLSGVGLIETNSILYGADAFISQTGLRITGSYRV